MSYHETYEFVALDRPLTARKMRALRAISTRAIITPTRFYNSYDWGTLKGDPHDMLRRYFDVFAWAGGYGDRWGLVRLPIKCVDVQHWHKYVTRQRARQFSRSVSFSTHQHHVVLTLSPQFDESSDDLFDEGNWIVSLVALRAELMAGDMRPLYLAWLLTVQQGEVPASAPVPVRPPGLTKLTGTLHAFAEYLGVMPALLKVAMSAKVTQLRTARQLLSAAE